MAKKRVTREPPARRGPIRNRAFGRGAPFQQASSNGKPNDEHQAQPRTPTEALQGAVEGTVAKAYTVIEQYLKRGQAAASRHYDDAEDGPTGPHPNGNGSAFPGAMPGGGPLPWDPWNMSAWMEPWTQAFRVWTEGMARFTGPGGAGWGPPAPARSEGPKQTVSVEVLSPKPVSVVLDLTSEVDDQQLSLAPLVHAGDSEVLLDGVELDIADGRCTVRLTVEEDQPTAAYVGTVKDGEGRTLGEITVVVRDPPPKKRRAASKSNGKR